MFLDPRNCYWSFFQLPSGNIRPTRGRIAVHSAMLAVVSVILFTVEPRRMQGKNVWFDESYWFI